MKNIKTKVIIVIIILIIIAISIFVFVQFNKKEDSQIETNEENLIDENPFSEIDKNEVSYQNTATVEELKENTGLTGETEIYQVEEEYDGRKVLAIKPSIKTKVAFAGMIKGAKPTLQESDNIVTEKMPKKSGIWLNDKNRDKIINLLNEVLDSKYKADENGYLQIENKDKQNEYDKKMEKAINSDKQYILDISSNCYIVDQVTGTVEEYLFEELDPYQTYYYLQDDNRMIIFLTENSKKRLKNTEIIYSMIDLL